MAASPISLNSKQIAPPRTPRRLDRTLRNRWLQVFFALVFVCCTSTTFMGGVETGHLLALVWKAVLGSWHYNYSRLSGPVNWELRKIGHFLGYGFIGVLFRNAWYSSAQVLDRLARRWLAQFSISLGVLSTFVVAGLDEWHQRYVPGRVSSFHDVLVDTMGALFLNIVLWAVRDYRRRRAALRDC